MSKAQVKELVRKGHAVGCHTWDHHDVTTYANTDWVKQLIKPGSELADITSYPIRYFAYPFGAWNESAVQQLKEHGYIAAFQLSSNKMASSNLYSIRRIIADGGWTSRQLFSAMQKSFH